jgi:microcystin-dependent protein
MDELIGCIKLFGGNFAPQGYMICQGQLLSIANYDPLFTIIGTTFGGDGRETFALPNITPLKGANYIIAVEGIYPERP